MKRHRSLARLRRPMATPLSACQNCYSAAASQNYDNIEMSLGESPSARAPQPNNGRLFGLRPDFCRFEVSSLPTRWTPIYKDQLPLFTGYPNVRKLCSDSAIRSCVLCECEIRLACLPGGDRRKMCLAWRPRDPNLRNGQQLGLNISSAIAFLRGAEGFPCASLYL
jgi:hypothetical protein